MPGGMEKMVRIISALADIQNTRRKLDLDEQNAKTQREQFAQQFGFARDSEHFKKATTLLQQIAQTSTAARSPIVELSKLLGMSEQEAGQFAQYAASAPESLETMRNAQIQAGLGPSASPFQREVAASQLTNQNQGQLAQSGLMQGMAQGAQGMVTPQMQQGFAERSATGRNPLEAFIQQQIMQNPAMASRMAGITAGTQQSAAQAAGNAVANRGVDAQYAGVQQRAIEAENQIAAQLAAGKGRSSLQDGTDVARTANDLLKTMADPKANQAVRDQAMAQYNMLMQQAGMPQLMWQTPGGGSASWNQRLWNQMSPPGPTGTPAPLPNPLQQFVRPSIPRGY